MMKCIERPQMRQHFPDNKSQMTNPFPKPLRQNTAFGSRSDALFLRFLVFLSYLLPLRLLLNSRLLLPTLILAFNTLSTHYNPVSANDNSHSPGSIQNKNVSKQSYLSCALITSEHLTTLQLYQRGFPKKLAIESMPNISRAARKRVDYIYDFAKRTGVLNAYSDINSNFARCATLVHKQKGIPPKDLKEYGYYFCSGENKVRYEILLYLDQSYSVEKIKTLVPEKHHSLIANQQRLIQANGMLAAFDLLANNLKECLKQIE